MTAEKTEESNKEKEDITFEDEYQEVSKEYNLPDFKSLNKLVHIEDIDIDSNILREISKRISDKLENYARIVEELLQPDQTLSSLHECNIFESNEKKELLELFKKLMYMCRTWQVLDLDNKDEEFSNYINKFYKDWNQIQPKLREAFVKIKKSWNTDFAKSINLEYFG